MIRKLEKLFGIMSDGFFVKSLCKGAAAGVEHRRVLLTLGKNIQHVVDIGANRGQFALIARRCYPAAKIDSFEPLFEPADVFEKVFVGDSNTRLHRVAIGSRKGTSVIHVSNCDDSSSLLPISELQNTLFPGTDERATRQIIVAPLAEMLVKGVCEPALLKIDVQGYELFALLGCLPLLQSFKYIYVECSFVELYVGQSLASEVIDFLSTHKFRLTGVYNPYYDFSGRAIQADLCFSSIER